MDDLTEVRGAAVEKAGLAFCRLFNRLVDQYREQGVWNDRDEERVLTLFPNLMEASLASRGFALEDPAVQAIGLAVLDSISEILSAVEKDGRHLEVADVMLHLFGTGDVLWHAMTGELVPSLSEEQLARFEAEVAAEEMPSGITESGLLVVTRSESPTPKDG